MVTEYPRFVRKISKDAKLSRSCKFFSIKSNHSFLDYIFTYFITFRYLSDNQISAIELGAFSSLVRLKILKLDGNRLTSITKNQSMFSRLEPLQQLDMSRNQINFLESLCFKGLGHLTVLNLSQNALWNMRSATFYHLKSLKYLDLSNNKLKQFKNDTLFGLGNLTSM